MVKIVDVNENNIDKQELFCKKTKKKFPGYKNKVNWMKKRFKEGLKYKVLYVKEGNKETSRGMIEYIPGKYNWRGIQADGWMVIHCIWVVGKAKGKGHGDKLLKVAIEDAKEQGMHGIVIMSTEKGGWLPNKKLLLKNGFEKVDEIEPYFTLYAKILNKDAPKPKFNPLDKNKQKEYSDGVTIIYTDQCPYITDLVEETKKINKSGKFNAIKINDCKEAQKNGVYPYGTYCIICDGNITLYQHVTKRTITSILNR
ncbi:MAG: GNAT family N-acetyltransferase [Candidatus Odinarchaeota archaeon]